MLINFANTLETLDPTHKFYGLIAAVAALLFIASTIGWLLKHRLLAKQNPSKKSEKVINNLISRVNAWWVMVAILVIAFLAGKLGTIILFGFISYFALREFMTLMLTLTRTNDHRTFE